MTSSTTKGGLCLATFLVAAMSAAQIQVNVDGDAVMFPDIQPQTINGQVMVPVRSVFEKMGATVAWDQPSQTVTADVNGKTVVLTIGDSEATVDGQMRYLPIPPQVVGDRTLVPMKFLGDALGNQLTWNGDTSLLAITVGASMAETLTTPPQTLHAVQLMQDEVIPVTLDMGLSSIDNHVGDTFTATVNASGQDTYANLPSGTKLEGHIAAVQPMQNGQPAILDLAFDRIDFPNGTNRPIDGALVSLSADSVVKDDAGMYMATNHGATFQRMVYAGYGSSGGRIVGVNDDRPVDDFVINDVIDGIDSQVPPEIRQPVELWLPTGTEIGVRINADTTITL